MIKGFAPVKQVELLQDQHRDAYVLNVRFSIPIDRYAYDNGDMAKDLSALKAGVSTIDFQIRSDSPPVLQPAVMHEDHPQSDSSLVGSW